MTSNWIKRVRRSHKQSGRWLRTLDIVYPSLNGEGREANRAAWTRAFYEHRLAGMMLRRAGVLQ